jgi:sialic acid synthase SpsE
MVHIIAEAGSNYNGDVRIARQLVDIARNSGADSVKFQIINTAGLYLPGQYEYGHYDINEVIRFREECELADELWQSVFDYASRTGISASASVFDKKGLDLLDSLNPPYIKIASCDLNNIRFLLQAAEKNRPIILSTGMSTLPEIEKSVGELLRRGKEDLVLMHCVSAYPAELSDMNLGFIDILKSTFGLETGLSDHTGTSIAACLALAKGVRYIEKHFTLDKTLPGLDHKHAMEAAELGGYVQDIRNASLALLDVPVKVGEKEVFTRRRARRSLYASRPLKAGDILGEQDILVVRPEGIMSADQYFDILGATLVKDMHQYEAFSPDSLR